jgi:NAD+ synthase (glutamine-hydrolysing)
MKSNATNYGLVRVAAVVPKIKVGDIDFNLSEIKKLIKKASTNQSSVITFPELCLTGYTLGDLFHQELILEKSLLALEDLKELQRSGHKELNIFPEKVYFPIIAATLLN